MAAAHARSARRLELDDRQLAEVRHRAARAAGLRAVYIPNANTWALEHTELDADDAGILHLRTFAELLDHF